MSSTTTTTPAEVVPETSNTLTSTRYIGQVKWFNVSSGYGFITACNSDDIFPKNDKGENDIFVHFSSIRRNKTTKTNNPFLMQGEYVEFSVIRADTPKVNKEGKVYEYHADDITGLFGGTMLCDHFNHNTFMNYIGNGAGAGAGANTANVGGRRRGGVSSGSTGSSRVFPVQEQVEQISPETDNNDSEFQKVSYKRVLTSKSKQM